MNVGWRKSVIGWYGYVLCVTGLLLTSPTVREPLRAQNPTVIAHTGHSGGRALDELLARPVTMTLANVSLTRAIDSLARVANIVVQYQLPALRAYTSSVSIRAANDPLGSVLERLLNGTSLRVAADGLGNLVLVSATNATSDSVPANVVAGRVVDSVTKAGIRGVTITVVGTKISTVTQDSGRFVLRNVPVGERILMVRTFGYRPTERAVELTADEPAVVRIQLTSVTTVLSGVVTTATGVQRKVEVGNDITAINVDSIMRTAPVTSVTDLLETRVPGLTVMRTSGAPGDPARIRLRGASSITGNNDPIVIVDGVRVYSSQSDPRSNNLAHTQNDGASQLSRMDASGLVSSFTATAAPSPLDQIDPNLIETIEVFKGPSASALYGSDAANGVIVITTKRGRAGKPNWNLTVGQGVNWLPGSWPKNYYRFGYDSTGITGINTGFCQWNNPRCAVDSIVPFQALNDPRYTVFAHGHDQTASASVSGGSPTLQYSLTGSAAGDIGNLQLPDIEVRRYQQFYGSIPAWMVRPDNYQTWSIGGQISANPTSVFHVVVSSTLFNSTQHRSSLEQAIAQLQGEYISDGNIYGASLNVGSDNEIGVLHSLSEEPLIRNETERVTAASLTSTNAMTITWQPYTWLPLTLTGGLNTIQRTDQSYIPYGVHYSGPGRCPRNCGDTTGAYSIGRGTSQDKTVTAGTSIPLPGITTAVGANLHSGSTNDFQASTTQLAPGVSVPTVFPTRVCDVNGNCLSPSLFGQSTSASSTYGWYVEPRLQVASRFFVAPGFRLDGGSASGENGGILGGLTGFPKIDFSWIAIDENQPRGILTLMRPRIAFGYAGTQPGPTQKLRLLNAGGDSLVPLNGSLLLPAVNISTLGNTQLQPETSRELEGGADLELWHGRFALTLTQYNKTRHNAIISLPVAPSVLTAQQQFVNVGVIRNTGTEVTTNIQVFQSRAIGWMVGANISTDHNQIVRLAPTFAPSRALGIVAGYPLFSVWSRPIAAFADANQNGIIDSSEVILGDSLVYLGQGSPKYQANFTSTLTLANGQLSVTGTFAYQNGLTQNNQGALTSDAINFLANTPGSSFATQAAALAAVGKTSTQDVTPIGVIQTVNTFRFNDLSINYTLPKRVSNRLRVPRAMIAVQGSNLMLHTNYRGKDPNVNAFSTVGSADQTADFGQIPQPRTWWLKLSLGN